MAFKMTSPLAKKSKVKGGGTKKVRNKRIKSR